MIEEAWRLGSILAIHIRQDSSLKISVSYFKNSQYMA
jgi:hypothetical protein